MARPKKESADPAVRHANGIQASIDLMRDLTKKRGFKLSTVQEIYASREDFVPSSPGLLRIFKGPLSAGTRIGLGGGTGVGKTSIANRLVADMRRAFPDRIVLVADFEQAVEGRPERVRASNWDFEDPGIQVLPWAGTAEGFYDLLIDYVRSGVPISGVVFDSLHSMSPKQQHKTELDDRTVGAQMAQMASMMSNVLRMSTGLLGSCHVTQIYLLQQRVNPGAGGAVSSKMGKAVDHYVDIMLTMSGGISAKTSQLTDAEDNIFGAISHVTATKKRKGAEAFKPLSQTELYVSFDGGIDDYMNLAVGVDEQYRQPNKQILTIPLPQNEVVRVGLLTAMEEGGYPVADTDGTYSIDSKDGRWSLVVKGPGKQSSLLGRVTLLANMMEDCPQIFNHFYHDFADQFEKPRLPVYPGAYTYPSDEELEAMLAELAQTGEVVPDA